MAEVLITIGIVGVIAAITIPAIKAEYQKRQIVEQLKQTYAQINQALKRAEVDYGEPDGWYLQNTGEEFFEKYLRPYLKVVKKYDGYQFWYETNRNVVRLTTYSSYTLYNGVVLSTCRLNETDYKGVRIAVDLNGEKEPNINGMDTFYFDFLPARGGLLPKGFDQTRDNLINQSTDYDSNCKAGSQSYNCAALIMLDGWKIEKDYPFGQTAAIGKLHR